MTLTFEQVLSLVLLLVVVLQAFFTARAIPTSDVKKLLEELRTASEATHTRIDDVLVELAYAIFGQIEIEEEVAPEEDAEG